MIAFAVPQIVALVVAGAVVTKTGNYVRLHHYAFAKELGT
jgi:hypothetical protein